MPIYEYTCTKCGKTFEELVSPSAGNRSIPCPSCGSDQTQQNLSTFAARSGGPRSGPSAGGGCGPVGPARGRLG